MQVCDHIPQVRNKIRGCCDRLTVTSCGDRLTVTGCGDRLTMTMMVYHSSDMDSHMLMW
jgi:hypothetical protein